MAVGIGDGEDTEIATPLRLAPVRTVDVANNVLTAEVSGSYAAFQAYQNGERALLALGAYGPNSLVEAQRLAVESNANPTGWFSLDQSIALAQPGQETVFLDPGSIATQPEQTSVSSLRSLQWVWWIAGVLLTGIVVGLALRAWRRRP